MLVQTTTPLVNFYHKVGGNYKVQYYSFSPTFNRNMASGQNLQSFSYQRAINNFSSEFTLSVKEDTHLKQEGFFDLVNTLDVVEIYNNYKDFEYNESDYIGIVTRISYSADSNGNKIINISGKGIEYLFELLTISLDTTAMCYMGSFVQAESENIATKLKNNKDSISIKDAVEQIYNSFTTVLTKQAQQLSNSEILNIINAWYGKDFLECDPNLKFEYPISSNLFTDSTISLPPYIRNLLPENVYEFYGVMVGGKPKIRIREIPFPTTTDILTWQKLRKVSISKHALQSYNLTRSIEEVYTVFYSYVEGSVLTPDFYMKVNASKDGFSNVEKNEKKIELYGYKPLCCNFCGFSTEYQNDSKTTNDLKTKFQVLNKKIKDWYENLDEMFDATIKCVDVHNFNRANVGEKVEFLKGEFYVTGIDYSWQYGQSPSIEYHCERGGFYDAAGKFSKLKQVTKQLAELEV